MKNHRKGKKTRKWIRIGGVMLTIILLIVIFAITLGIKRSAEQPKYAAPRPPASYQQLETSSCFFYIFLLIYLLLNS